MAICAVCQQPIVTPDRFVIDGTEVMHRACARTGQRTVLQRALVKLADAESRAATDHRLLVEAQTKIAELQRQGREQAQDKRRIQEDHRHLVRVRDLHRAETERAIAERDAARRELALHQTLARQTPVVTTAAAPDPAHSGADARDATEVRMSLLELDAK
jgi:hypothetical protein